VGYGDPAGYSGFGDIAPAKIDNNGDPGGVVEDITWSDWGKASAFGVGYGFEEAPGGGYGPRLRMLLTATHLEACDGVPTYAQLLVRDRRDPSGQQSGYNAPDLWSGGKDMCLSIDDPVNSE
jgi:hypothetical protein